MTSGPLSTSARWPSGQEKTIAVLRESPAELTTRLGVVFTAMSDDLDSFVECAPRLASGRLVLLLRYLRNPRAGTEILIDSEDDARAALDELHLALGTADEAIAWFSPELHGPLSP
jgi:hypothetical protein